MAKKIVRGKKTNIVTLGDNVVEIISVTGKASNATFFTPIRDYSFTGNQVIARRVYDEIKVEYEDGIKTEYQKKLEKDFLNGQVSLLGGAINISRVTDAGSTAKTQRSSVEVSKNGSVLGLNVGGLVSLAENVQERIATTDEPVVSILTDTVSNVNLNEIVTVDKGDLSTLTGKTIVDGFLKTIVTTGSPNGLNNALATANVPQAKRKTALQECSVEPATVVTVTATDNPREVITSSFTKQRDVTVKRQNNVLGNPVGSFKLGNLGGFGSGPVGIPGTSMLGSLVGKLLGVSIPSVPGLPTPSLPDGVTLPTGVEPLPDIVETSGQTNISKVVSKPTAVSPNVRNTIKPRDISAESSKFEGALSTARNSTYVFENVGGPEELQFEFRNATRTITTMVVHWSRTYSDLDWDAKDVGGLHTATQLANKPPGYTDAELLYSLGTNSGLQFHYLIRRDGTIQVGRPLNLIGPINTGFANYAVHVGFVGGFNCPRGTPEKERFLSSKSYTPEQWKSFDVLVKAFDAAKNGAGEFVGFNQFTRYGMLGPGFSVPEYVASKFGKGTVYTAADFEKQDALSPQEIVSRKPQKPIVNPTPPNNPPPKPQVIEIPEPGVPTQTEIDARNKEYKAALREEERLVAEANVLSDEVELMVADPNVDQAAISAKEDYYNDDLWPRVEDASIKVRELKKAFINDNYLYLEKESKWIHGSQYNDYN